MRKGFLYLKKKPIKLRDGSIEIIQFEDWTKIVIRKKDQVITSEIYLDNSPVVRH